MAPTAARRSRRCRAQSRLRAPPGRSGSPRRMIGPPSLITAPKEPLANARVEPGIDEIDNGVRHHEEKHNDEHTGLHDGIITIAQGGIYQRTEAGPSKYGLDKDRLADQVPDADTQY